MTPLKDRDGKIRGFAKIMRDLTERKMHEEYRQQAEERFHFLVEAVKDYAIFMLDTTGRVVSWNSGAERIKGYSREEIIGKHFELFYTQEDRAQNKPYRNLQVATRNGQFEEVGWRVRKNGDRFIAEIIIYVLKSQSGELRGFAKITRDVTEQKQLLERLEEQSRLLDAANIFARTLDGEIIFWNTGSLEMYGYSIDEAIGANAHQLFATRYPKPLEEINTELLQYGKWSGELVQCRKSGGTFSVWSHWVLHRGTDGKEIIIEVNNDITERKKLEQALWERTHQLEQADRNKDEFIAVLSHELRNPLAPIKNITHVLRQKTTEQQPVIKQMTEILERQVSGLTRLVDDLLDVARIQTGDIKLKKELLDLNIVIKHAVETASSEFKSRQQDLIVELYEEPLWIEGDPIRLEQAILNILNNASKYTAEGGLTQLSATLEGEKAVIRVKDTGFGIDENILPNIFDLFKRGNGNGDQKGLGVGLALVRRIIEMHEGFIEAASPGKNKGSEFILYLPIRDMPVGLTEPPFSQINSDCSKLRILVVDDNADSAESLALLLKMSGHDVQTAFSGSEALTLAEEERPEVIILDIKMPGMDGYAVAASLKDIIDVNKVTLVALTGYGQEGDRQRSKQAGFAFHMTKPINTDELQTILKQVAAIQ